MNKKVKVIIASILVIVGVSTSTLLIENKKEQEIAKQEESKKQEPLEDKKEAVEKQEEVIQSTENIESTEVLKEDVDEAQDNVDNREISIDNSNIESYKETVTNEVEIKYEEETNNKASMNSNFISEIESEIIRLVNEERAKASVAALQYNSTMEYYARIKSKDMGDNGYFDHNDLNGQLITTQMKNDGIFYNAWGENIAYIGGGNTNYQQLARQFMTNWMNSDGHRKNILSTNFTGIGVGVYKIGNTYYATQEFYR